MRSGFFGRRFPESTFGTQFPESTFGRRFGKSTTSGHLPMKKYIFQPSFETLTFVLGAAYSNNMFPAHLKTRWIKFLQYYMPLIHSLKDCFTKQEYEEIAQFFDEIEGFAKGFKEVRPGVRKRQLQMRPGRLRSCLTLGGGRKMTLLRGES